MERAVALARGSRVDLEDLPEEMRQAFPKPVVGGGTVQPLSEVEKEYILAALQPNGGNQTRTAEQLRIGWRVDFVFKHADGRNERVRRQSPVQTKRGAEDYERQLRQVMLNPRPEGKDVPIFSRYAEEFMTTYAETNTSRVR